MAKRMNLYFHDEFYELLVERVGEWHISQFIEENLTPLISNKDEALETVYSFNANVLS